MQVVGQLGKQRQAGRQPEQVTRKRDTDWDGNVATHGGFSELSLPTSLATFRGGSPYENLPVLSDTEFPTTPKRNYASEFPPDKEALKIVETYQKLALKFKEKFFNKAVIPYAIDLIDLYVSKKGKDLPEKYFYKPNDNKFRLVLRKISQSFSETTNPLDGDDIKILIKHATHNFYAHIISKIRKDIEPNKTKLKKRKVKLLENIIESYNNLTKERNAIIKIYEPLIYFVIHKKLNCDKQESTLNAGLNGLIEAIDTNDSKKEASFKTYAVDMIRFSIQNNLTKATRRRIVDPLPFTDFASKNNDSDCHGQVADPRDPYSQKNVETAHKLLGYTCGREKYIIQISCGFYAKNECKYDNSLGIMSNQRAHKIYQRTIEKLKFISEAVNYSLTQDEINDIKNEIKEKLPTIPNNYRKTISKHFGLDGNIKYSRAELSEDFNLRIETIDTYIFNALKGTFSKDPEMFNKALKFSLTIEDEFKKENSYPLPHNLYSILTEEESRFLKCRYDWKNRIFKDLNQVANDLNTDIKKLIEIERRVIEKLKKYEPETFPKICAIFKANIKNGNIKSSFVKNALFMLSSLQFEIINLRRGITTSEKLSKEDIIKKLSIDARTYYKEYKKAVSILREFRLKPTHTDLEFLKAFATRIKKPRDRKIFKLKFIKHLTPDEIAKKLNIPLEKYLLVERKLFANNIFTKKEKNKLFYLYRKDFLEKENLTYKEKLENSIFILTTKNEPIATVYSFGLFGKNLKSISELDNMFKISGNTIRMSRTKAIKKLENFLSINYLNELYYRETRENEIPISAEAYNELKKELLRALNEKRFSATEREIFYRNFGFSEKENYDEMAKNLSIDKEQIYALLTSTMDKLYKKIPEHILNKFLAKHLSLSYTKDDITQDNLITEIQRTLPLFSKKEQKIIISLFGLFREHITPMSEVIKKLQIPKSSFGEHKRRILTKLNQIFPKPITNETVDKIRQMQEQNEPIETKKLKFLKTISLRIENPKHREIFKLKFIMHLTPKQIAKKLNMSLKEYLLEELKFSKTGYFFTEKTKNKYLKKIYKIYREDCLKNKDLTYKKLLENFIFTLSTENKLNIIIYSFGLFGENIKNTDELSEMLKTSPGVVRTIRIVTIEQIEKYLNIKYLDELRYRNTKKNEIPISAEAYNELKKELLRALKNERFSATEREIFYRNFGFSEKENYDEIAKNLSIDKEQIYALLTSTMAKLYKIIPEHILNKFLAKYLSLSYTKDDITQDNLITEIQRTLPIFDETKRKIIISLFGLFNKEIKSSDEITKENKIHIDTFYQYRKEILNIFSQVFNVNFSNETVKMLRQKQKNK